MCAAQERVKDFERATALTERLIEKFYDEELTFDAAIGGALTVILQCLLRGSSNQDHTLGLLGSSLNIAVAASMERQDVEEVTTPNEEILEMILNDEDTLH
jgi:hypothetical protein|tara:strand:+ start:471 stop:773 length:303 start_codon:yes stop_codon:yes gene_type:complete